MVKSPISAACCASVASSNPGVCELVFTPFTLRLNWLDRMAGLVSKPAVGPWVSRFIPAQLRTRSSALKKPVEAPVPVFSG
jgi:hypothetical protein